MARSFMSRFPAARVIPIGASRWLRQTPKGLQVARFAPAGSDGGPKFTQIAEIPTGSTELQRTNPRDLDLSADGNTLYVANTLGHTIAVINVTNDTNQLVKNMPLGGLATDVKISGKWGIVSGQETNTRLNEPETGHGLPTLDANGVAIKNDGTPLGYTPVMSDATKAITFDDIGSEFNIFDITTNEFVYRYVVMGRDCSQLVIPGDVVDLQDHTAALSPTLKSLEKSPPAPNEFGRG
jgi:hypothetical protein